MSAPPHIGGILAVERRRAARAPLGLAVVFPLADKMIQAKALDISVSGMQFTCEATIPKGTLLTLRFILPGEALPRTLTGHIAWSRAPAPGERDSRFGFAFRNAPKDVTERIAALVAGQGDIPEVADADVQEVDEMESPAQTLVEEPLNIPGGIPITGQPTWAEDLQAAIRQDTARQAGRVQEARSRYERAQECAASGALDEAVTLLEQALTFTPEAGEVVEELARVLYLKGNVVRAAELFDRALRLERGLDT